MPAGVSDRERKDALRFIVFLGVVSLFADMTYEGARAILGPYLKELGASAAQVGLIAGVGEMIAASLRFFSGRFVDRTLAYWGQTILGYSLNVIVVPAMAFAGNWKIAAILVLAERTAKSLRGPARDVLLSEATDKVGHGWGFGLHGAMDQIGAVVGPLLVAAAVARAHHFAPAFLLLAFPAVGTMIALVAARLSHPQAGVNVPQPARQERLPPVFWRYVIAGSLLAAGFLDFPLLAYHFQTIGVVQPPVIPILYAGAMAINGLSALVLGRLFDRYGVRILGWGTLAGLLALPLGLYGGLTGAILGVACWAIGMGAQDACLRSGIAQVVSMNKRGSAFGTFNGCFGVAWFAGSALMGLLYGVSFSALVVFGVGLQLAAAVLFFRLQGQLQRSV